MPSLHMGRLVLLISIICAPPIDKSPDIIEDFSNLDKLYSSQETIKFPEGLIAVPMAAPKDTAVSRLIFDLIF